MDRVDLCIWWEGALRLKAAACRSIRPHTGICIRVCVKRHDNVYIRFVHQKFNGQK